MDRVQIIQHQGKKILYIDFTSLDSVDLISSVLQEVKTYVHAQPPFSVYSLVNVEGMHFNNKVKEMFTEVVKSNKPYVKASAVIGVSGLLQIMFNGLMKITGREVKSFNSLELAKNWLVSQN
jgi:hypothetical protein